jgi:hypothetical protein
MSSNPPPILENTPPPLPPPRRRSTAIDETRVRVHGIHHSPSEISALRDMIEKRLSDSEQQRMDALFSAFVDTLREAQVRLTTSANLVAFPQYPSNYYNLHRNTPLFTTAHLRDVMQVAGMSESEVLKTLDSPVRFTGSQCACPMCPFDACMLIARLRPLRSLFSSRFIDWVVQFKAASAIKSGEVGARSETSGTPAASSVSRDRDLHEAHLLMLVDRCDVCQKLTTCSHPSALQWKHSSNLQKNAPLPGLPRRRL